MSTTTVATVATAAPAAPAAPNAPAATGLSTWDNHRHTGYGPDPWKPRNDKVKFDEGAWSGPGWHGKKEIEPTK